MPLRSPTCSSTRPVVVSGLTVTTGSPTRLAKCLATDDYWATLDGTAERLVTERIAPPRQLRRGGCWFAGLVR